MGRIEREKRTVETMIRLYCRKREGNREFCGECRELMDYAHTRLERCPFGDKKSYCNQCERHCYKPFMRDKIRDVMRFSGPRMFIYSPVDAILHLFGGLGKR